MTSSQPIKLRRFFVLMIMAFTGHACDQLHFALKIKDFENKKLSKFFAKEMFEKKTLQCHLDYST